MTNYHCQNQTPYFFPFSLSLFNFFTLTYFTAISSFCYPNLIRLAMLLHEEATTDQQPIKFIESILPLYILFMFTFLSSKGVPNFRKVKTNLLKPIYDAT